MAPTDSCTYVSQGWGVHDKRWVAALRDCGFTVTTFSRDRDGKSIEEIRHDIDRSDGPVLAGPLDSITPALLGIDNRLIGLSWGFDLFEMRTSDTSLDWLSSLDAIIVDSTSTRGIAVDAGANPENVHVIPWGVDQDKFSDEGPRLDLETLGLPKSAVAVVTLRAHEARYRVHDIIEAFAEVAKSAHDAHLVIGNDGSQRNGLERYAAKKGIQARVTFIGSWPEDDLAPLFRACNLYITASEIDGSSVTLLQAISCGVPVLASDTPGNREWVTEHETGRLFESGSVSDLARVLSEALEPANLINSARMAQTARKNVMSRANWSRNYQVLAEIMSPIQHGSS